MSARCRSGPRYFQGMRLVLQCDLDGCVCDFDLVPANALERDAVLELLERRSPSGRLLIADKGFAGKDFEQAVRELGALLLRPSRHGKPRRLKPQIGRIRQQIESIVNSLQDQFRLEHHLAKTPGRLLRRITTRILALTTAIHLNLQPGQPSLSLTVYGD